MKFPLVSFLFFIGISAFCQDSFILKRDGSRIDFQKNSIQIIIQDKILSYKSMSGSQKDIDFNDIDHAFFGNYKFKYFKFKENKSSNCYFVLSESDKHTLICLGVPDSVDDEQSVNVKIKYEMYILDKQNLVVDSLTFSNQNNANGATARSLISEKISAYFKTCDSLMTRFADFERLDEPQYMGLVGFFKVPNFVNCVN